MKSIILFTFILGLVSCKTVSVKNETNLHERKTVNNQKV